jgi:hypothetical protein
MMRHLVVLFLLLTTSLVSAQQSNEASRGSTICFSESEFAALEAEAQRIVEDTARAAVDAALAPHIALEAELRTTIANQVKEVRIWRTTTWIMFGFAAALIGITVVSYLIPQVP